MELFKLKQSIVLDYKALVCIFVITLIMYFVYIMPYNFNTSIITVPITNQDSPYLSPEGWPMPYPYVAPYSN